MKWYHKTIYRLANSVLPTAVKQQMMGIGRMTVPKNANPWNMFNWLPKKYQAAHNIDLTKLQSYTAEELLELLISVHPDVSDAIHTYLRMGDTDLSFKAVNMDGKPDANGQRIVDELKAMLNTPLSSPGYQHGRSIDKLDGIQRLMVMVRGACAGEVVLNEQVNDVVDIVPVDPALIWFRREPNTNRLIPWQFVRNPKFDQQAPGEWFGNYKRIDTPTFIYEELDPMVDDPYGRTPILPVLQVVFFHIQVLQDIKAVVHNQGYPRMNVKILEEIMLKNMPAQFKNDPNAQRKWLTDRLGEFQGQFNSLNPDDAIINWDSVEVSYIQGGNTGPIIDIKKLIDVIDTQLATSLKTLLTLLSRHQGSTETYSSVDVQLYIKTVESARNVTKRFWERAFSLAARVKGVQTQVKGEYGPIDLRSEQQQEDDRKKFIENIESADSNFYITSEEAATEVRKSLGLDPDIPPELADKLKTKHEPVETPTQENPSVPPTPSPSANRRVKLNAQPDDSAAQLTSEEQFIGLYMALMSHIKSNIRHATTVEAVLASMQIGNGMQDQMTRGLWQLYRNVYLTSYNVRALATGSDLIRNPDTQTSIQMRMQSSQVISGTTQTFHDSLSSAWQTAIDATKDLSDSERLTQVKKAMTEWLDENAAYKSAQIAQHEAINAYHEGLFAHDTAHAPATMYDVVPDTTEHAACAELIEGGPYTLDEAMSLTLPLHPNCPHHFAPRGGDN